MPSKGALRATTEEPGRSLSRTCSTEGEQGAGRTSAARPCPHVDIDTAQIFGGASSWIPEGEKRDSYRAYLPWSAEELQRDELLGTGVFCVNGRR